jgi:hypothetical protein
MADLPIGAACFAGMEHEGSGGSSYYLTEQFTTKPAGPLLCWNLTQKNLAYAFR